MEHFLTAAVAAAVAEDSSWRSEAGFPRKLWRRLGGKGLLGIGFPAAAGGQGRSLVEVAEAGGALVRATGSLGLGLGWLMNEMLGWFALGRLGTAAQRAALLPAMARGEVLCALAISEPGVGAHPKHLSARAQRDGDGWRLDGEKAFVSNGPNADWFIVVAVSGEADGRKRFSAFLLPADAPGLAKVQREPVAGLTPLGHCGLKLEACKIGPDNMLGEEGSAFEALAKPFRDVEDALLPALLVGAMGRELAELGRALGPGAGEAERQMLGRLLTELAALAATARDSARGLEQYGVGAALSALNTGFKELARRWQGDWQTLADLGSDAVSSLKPLTQDVNIVINIARRVGQARQQTLGAALLTEKAAHEVTLRTSF